MTGESVKDSGNSEGDKTQEGGKVADTFRTLHERIKDTPAAIRYPSSDDQPATVAMIHTEEDQVEFSECFADLLRATRDGTVELLDLSHMGADAA